MAPPASEMASCELIFLRLVRVDCTGPAAPSTASDTVMIRVIAASEHGYGPGAARLRTESVQKGIM